MSQVVTWYGYQLSKYQVQVNKPRLMAFYRKILQLVYCLYGLGYTDKCHGEVHFQKLIWTWVPSFPRYICIYIFVIPSRLHSYFWQFYLGLKVISSVIHDLHKMSIKQIKVLLGFCNRTNEELRMRVVYFPKIIYTSGVCRRYGDSNICHHLTWHVRRNWRKCKVPNVILSKWDTWQNQIMGNQSHPTS